MIRLRPANKDSVSKTAFFYWNAESILGHDLEQIVQRQNMISNIFQIPATHGL